MDAISDVSRASQIFSTVPRGPPLPDPVDRDELLGFSKAQRIILDEKTIDTKYFDKNKIFINHVDSYVGKYMISTLSKKITVETRLKETLSAEPNETIIIKAVSKTGTKSKIKSEKSSMKSKEKSAKKTNKEQKKQKSLYQEKTSTQPIIEIEDDLRKSKNKVQFNTSNLTVAEYYELIETEPGIEREEYLTDKLGKYGQGLKTKPYPSPEELIPRTDERRTMIDCHKSGSFEIFGTLKNNQVEKDKFCEGVSKILQVTENGSEFLNDIIKCGTIIYIVNEDQEQVLEAFWVLDSLINRIEEMKEGGDLNGHSLPFMILISSFMTWSLTKPLDPKELELPLIENDYRKRCPHPNFQLLYELEEHIIKLRSNGELEAVILACGIPYGYEENVFSFYFEFAYHSIDLPVFGSGSNIIPVIHVESIGLITKDVLKRRGEINIPFVFAKDPVPYTLKEVAQAISSNFGSGCCIMMANPFAFLKKEITQHRFDQLTANILLESCYPLFNEKDIDWKYGSGFVENMTFVVKEYMSANNLKPLHIVVYGSVNFNDMKNVISKLSECLRIPFLVIEDVLNDYINEMQKKLNAPEEAKGIGETNKDLTLNRKLTDPFEAKQECKEEAEDDESLEVLKRLKVQNIENASTFTPVERNRVLRKTLKKRLYINHGYILFNFPQTLEEAKLLFPLGKLMPDSDDQFLPSDSPDFIIYLNKFQGNIPTVVDISADYDNKEEEMEDIRTNLEEFSPSAQKYSTFINDADLPIDGPIFRTNIEHHREILEDIQDFVKHGSSLTRETLEDQPVVKYLLNNNDKCKLVNIAMTEADSPDTTVQQILKLLEENGSQENYSENNLYDDDEVLTQEIFKKQNEKHLNKDTEIQTQQDCNEEIKDDEAERIKEAEEVKLAVRSHPLLSYLINFVFPTLTDAILEVTAVKPDDPSEFLAEYLFKHNPDGRMLDPSESNTEEDFRNKRNRIPKISSKVCLA